MTGEAYLVSSIGRGPDRKLHRDEDCPHLQKANGHRPVDPDHFPDLEGCGACADDGADLETQSQDWGPIRSLKAAAEGGDAPDA